MFSISDAFRDLVPFVQFEKREKHPWRSVISRTLLHGRFSRFLNCANGTKSRKTSHVKIDSFASERNIYETCSNHLITKYVGITVNWEQVLHIFPSVFDLNLGNAFLCRLANEAWKVKFSFKDLFSKC